MLLKANNKVKRENETGTKENGKYLEMRNLAKQASKHIA